jgi:hypothetical protein
VTTLLLTVALAATLAVPMHWWPRLAATHRRRLALATSLAGLGFLVAALRSEGQRDTALRSLVLVGPATATAHASATASLYYYVLTGFCLLLGFTGLIASDPLARWLRPRALLSTVAVAWLVTLVRALLEKSAAPPVLVDAVGVTWLAPVAGAYLAVALQPRRSGAAALWPELLRYAYLVRLVIAAVGVTATRLGAGTHYDVSPLTEVAVAFADRTWVFEAGSWTQLFWLTLLPQLLIWPAFTVLVGMAGAALAFALMPAVDVATASEAAEVPAGVESRVDTSDAPSGD